MRDRIEIKKKLIVAIAAISMVAASCSGSDATDAAGTEVTSDAAASVVDNATSVGIASSDIEAGSVFDATMVHSISVEFDEADYDELIAAYKESSEKEWISATVTIDGTTYEDVGLRLKGNSSLRSLASGGGGGTGGEISEDEPEGLPWLIRLDKYIDHQNHDGSVDFVVRSNASETSLNEAVALDLLEAAGLASQDAIAVRFTVNGSEERLRLVIENPDDVFMASNFDDSGALYKAESTGDYNYHGEDPGDYDEVFDQEAGKDNADLTPVIEFMDFLNNSDDETFAAELGDWLDVDSFATYLAMQEIINNFDDIDGPGNNSYLYWDTDDEQFTVVPWDHNLSFGGLGAAGGFGGGAGFGGGDLAEGDLPEGFDPENLPEGFEQGQLPEGFDPADLPEGFEPGERPTGAGQGGAGLGDERQRPEGAGQGGGFGGGGFGGSNTLVDRFLADADFEALYDQTLIDLNVSLIDSGIGASILSEWVEVLKSGASDLVDTATIESEASSIGQSL